MAPQKSIWARVRRPRSFLVVVAACLIGAAALSACGSSSSSSSSTTASSAASTPATSASAPSGSPIVTYTFTDVNTQGPQYKNIEETMRVYNSWINAHGGI